ncbi:hypothetical protein FRX31_013247 [Thalictrum thalictroides]|uniref:Uncharacterized protein n=1 Tax=Thalictrum thalictroides TaxID=46969 RepID=A0A7J6WIB7_THATH|nr:hypothetical protein FRX31_013247 [Thalictrum thalictroides]
MYFGSPRSAGSLLIGLIKFLLLLSSFLFHKEEQRFKFLHRGFRATTVQLPNRAALLRGDTAAVTAFSYQCKYCCCFISARNQICN